MNVLNKLQHTLYKTSIPNNTTQSTHYYYYYYIDYKISYCMILKKKKKEFLYGYVFDFIIET